jgi:hypothetical protein
VPKDSHDHPIANDFHFRAAKIIRFFWSFDGQLKKPGYGVSGVNDVEFSFDVFDP